MRDNRFIRTEAMIGSEAMQRLRFSKVMVVGSGAVGGYAIEALARSGVGTLYIVDFDVFDISNINRQILATSSTIGRKKAEVAKERVLDINPDCNVVIVDMFLDKSNIDKIFEYDVDYYIDAIDTIGPKCCLIGNLLEKKKDFISSMGAGRRLDPSMIKVVKLEKTRDCALAKLIRKYLRRNGVDISDVVCVYSSEKPMETDFGLFDIEKREDKFPLGSIATITAIFGLTLANEVIKRIAKI